MNMPSFSPFALAQSLCFANGFTVKIMALTPIDLFMDLSLVARTKEEFKKNKGDYQYKALLGDRQPALNYRD